MNSAFFSKRDHNAVPFVTIAHVYPMRPVRMCVCVAQPVGYNVHWANRAVFCPGEGCEMCRTNSCRSVFSLIGFVSSDRKLIEVSAGTIDSMRLQLQEQGASSFEGSCWEFTKERKNGCITARLVKIQKTSLLMTMTHLRVVARCFSLCDAHEGETVQQYEADLIQAARQRILRMLADLDRVGVGSRSA
jgi:hypothetical protein